MTDRVNGRAACIAAVGIFASGFLISFRTSVPHGGLPLALATIDPAVSLPLVEPEHTSAACHECSLGSPGARTYEVMIGLADDEADGTFRKDFQKLVEGGFQNPAFPPSTRQTEYSIPGGFAGTTCFKESPTTIDFPECRSLDEAVTAGTSALKINVQTSLDEVFRKMAPSDTFVLYLSSHAKCVDGAYEFGMNFDLTYDESASGPNGEIAEKAAHPKIKLALKDFDFSKCPACTLMIVADTCYSATMVENMIPKLQNRTGNVILVGSAAKVAGDWQGAMPRVLSTEQGNVSIDPGGVFTNQFLRALEDPTNTGDVYAVVSAAAERASNVANAFSLHETGHEQTATVWTRPIPSGEVCPKLAGPDSASRP